MLFCHATPRNDTEIFTSQTPEQNLIPVFENVAADVVVCGHTHIQFDRMVGKKRVVNAGSVGMPFGKTGADWLLLGPDIEFCHTDYDLQQAAKEIRLTEYPGADAFASNNVINPPSEQEMLAAFQKSEIR